MNIILRLSLLLLSIGCVSQNHKPKKESLLVLDSIIKIAELNSVYTKNVNWNKLKKEMYSIELKSDSINSIIAPVTYMYQKIGDTHGYLMINNQRHGQKGIEHTIEKRKTDPKLAYQIYQRIAKKDITFKLLSNNIAYIEIPMVINNDSLIITKIRKAICFLKAKKPNGWIIDLRTNMGGNLSPMAAGIGGLFPNLPFGGGTKDGIRFNLKWKLENGNFYMNNIPISEIPLNCNIASKSTRVAVLISRYTASSGEAIASGLKGQKNIKVFGEQTIGAATTINWYPINDKITLCPAIDYYMSEDKTVHRDGVIPDVLIEEKLELKELTKGITISTATQWLIKK